MLSKANANVKTMIGRRLRNIVCKIPMEKEHQLSLFIFSKFFNFI